MRFFFEIEQIMIPDVGFNKITGEGFIKAAPNSRDAACLLAMVKVYIVDSVYPLSPTV